MSYDLAVWEDVPPFRGRTPDEAYELLCDRMEDDRAAEEPPSPAITAFVEALLAIWPDLGEPGDERSPWTTEPLLADGFGPCIYLTMTFSGAGEAVPVVARIARERGLVCYDPQFESVI